MEIARTQNFIDTTKTEFQCYQDEPITDSQALKIQNNFFGAVDLLLQWTNKK